MNLKFIIYLFLLLTFFISCKHKHKQQAQEELIKVEVGKITNYVKCQHNYNVTYSVYLPTGKTCLKPFPVIFAFDPHGDGSLPVKLYSKLAEKYGFILIGSNNSKNGQNFDEILNSFTDLLDDVKHRLPVDSNNFYTLGFSGGARIAGMLTLANRNIKGAICCSAGIDANSLNGSEKISYVFITGTEDMNYLEVKRSYSEIQEKSISSSLIVFEGKHDWAKEDAMDEAFLYFSFKILKPRFTPSDTSLVKTYASNMLAKANNQTNFVKKAAVLKQLIATIDGFTNTGRFEQSLSSVKNHSNYKKQSELIKLIEDLEEQQQRVFAESFVDKDIVWWQNQVERLNKETKLSQLEKAQSAKRLLNYISLLAYSASNSALQASNVVQAESYLKIYQMVDPQNPDMFYFTACLLCQEGEVEAAIEMLHKAIANGFVDISRLQNDPLLQMARMSDGYQKLYASVKK